MRNIFLLLTCLLCLQACNDEKDVDWTPDVLTVSSDETLEEAGDGHWKVTLPTEYKGAVKLEIKTDKSWEVAVSYMTNEIEEWITPSVEGGNGSASLSLAIADNKTARDRKASVVITTRGEIPVKKTITVVQGNVNELLAVGTIDEANFPKDVFITTDTDGSFAVTLPKDFAMDGAKPLNILTYKGTVTPEVEIAFIDEEHKDWVVFTENPVAPISDPEIKTLALTVKKNEANIYREALVNFTATAGDVISKKTVKIIQYGVEKIIWNEEYCQQECEFIVSADANEKMLVATCENINPVDIETSGDNTWLTLTQENGMVYAKIAVNESTNTERTTEISIKNKKTNVVSKISFRQGMHGYGIILGKSLWSITSYSENLKKQYDDNSIKKLFDRIWTAITGGEKHVEFNGRSASDDHTVVPYMLTLDLGENPRKYDSFGFMPRLQWTQQAPKTVAIEVSDDLVTWTTAFAKVAGNCFTQAELQYEGPYNGNKNDKYNDHYEGIVHWCKLSTGLIQKRYIRLSLYESFQGLGRNVALDEVFASDRSNIE